MPSAWNMFVKKIYQEGKAKDSSYEFKQALKDASKRKSEMGNASSVQSEKNIKSKSLKKKSSKSRKNKSSKSKSVFGSLFGGKTRRRNSKLQRR